MEEDFVQEIKDRIATNFKVTKIPGWALRKFKKLCKKEYGDVYFVGIIQLMKIKEQYEILLNFLKNKELNLEEKDGKIN